MCIMEHSTVFVGLPKMVDAVLCCRISFGGAFVIDGRFRS